MELRHLRYFVAVAEELHFGRAAKRLNIAQPPLSQQIRKLEHELKAQLLERNQRRVELTSAGRLFLEQARVVLAEAERAVRVAQRADRGEIGQLAIGHAPPADLSVLPALLSAYRRRYPDVTLVLRSLSGPALVAALRSERVRVAVLRLPLDDPDLGIDIVLRERLIAVLPEGHPLAREERVSLRQFAREPFILFPRHLSPRYHDRIAAMCLDEGGFTLSVAQEADTIQTTLGLVAAGLGISLQPDSVRNLGRAGVAYRPLAEPSPLAETGVAYRRQDRSEILRGFLGIIGEVESTLRRPPSRPGSRQAS